MRKERIVILLFVIHKNIVLQIPQIDFIIQENKMKILLNLTNNPLYKHEYKEKKSWGSLRETYAAALFYETELIEKMNKNKNFYIWDPFAGSGTLLIEAFSIIFQRHARKIKTISEEGFTNLPFHEKGEFNIFLKEEMKLYNSHVINVEEEFQCNFIASDMDNKSLTALSQNCQKGKLNNYKFYSENKILNKSEDSQKFLNPVIYSEKINNVFDIFLGDFEAIAKNVIFSEINKNKKFNIFTHLPYGISTHMDDKVKLKKLYERFGKFLRKNDQLLDDVYVIINKRNQNDLLNFKMLSEVKWNSLIEFENNGITVELLKFIRD